MPTNRSLPSQATIFNFQNIYNVEYFCQGPWDPVNRRRFFGRDSEGSFSYNSGMITGIDHIGIAVRSLDDSLAYWRDALGLECTHVETVESQKIRVAMLPVAGVNVELLEPTSPESPVAKFLEKNGEGIHHVAFRTDDVAGQLARAKEHGVSVVHEVPFEGAHGKLAAFLHPKSTHGVLTEFSQLPKK